MSTKAENIHFDLQASDAQREEDIKQQNKGIIGGVAGFAASLVAGTGLEFWLREKLRPFTLEVNRLASEDIMKRAGAGFDSMGSHIIHDKYKDQLLQSGQWKFAKFIDNMGGKMGFISMVSLAIGAVVALGYWAANGTIGHFSKRMKENRYSSDMRSYHSPREPEVAIGIPEGMQSLGSDVVAKEAGHQHQWSQGKSSAEGNWQGASAPKPDSGERGK